MPELCVVECSLAAKWALPGPDREAAIAVYRRRLSDEIKTIAPDLILVEFASVASKCARRKLPTGEQAREAFDLFATYAPEMRETGPLLPAALDLSLRHGISLWDAVYVALAVQHHCRVLTADRRLSRSPAARELPIQFVP